MTYKPYNHSEIEPKWQKVWEEMPPYKAVDFDKKPKYYALVEFPYPSGDGIHLGHAFTNTILDILARKKRLSGFNVLHPMGWDAFGLPTENYAVKMGIQPAVATKKNTGHFRMQDKKLGLSYDWDREIDTTDPNYFKWTQWIFLKFFEKGLAYKAETPVGWCPSCKIILANEEIVDSKCERCGTPAEHRMQKQWLLKITAYADRLADELDLVDYPTSAKQAQRNWIGRKEGTLVKFGDIEVFTTRIDTIYGATFMVIAPEHPLALELAKNSKEIADYLKETSRKSEIERLELSKEKTGVDTGLKVINPATNKEIPVWISDFVLAGYGTGAIMSVPAYDDRDRDFATKFNLPIVTDFELVNDPKIPYKKTTTYHLRDWVFSRQHYWGEPIPIIDCPKCGLVPVPEDQLPLRLPEVEKYQPTQTGESPLANIASWVNTKCPKCGGPAKRETDTMPNWAGSSWYYLRFCDPNNSKTFADYKKMEYWGPVDMYFGGPEHITLHLLYSRFWHKFLNDLGLVPGKEPYTARRTHGMILAENGSKMSKSKGNVINPDDLINKYGADALRVYLAFMGPYESTMPWSSSGIEGSRRFIQRIWDLFHNADKIGAQSDPKLAGELNKTIKKVGDDIDNLKHNTAVAFLMTFLNYWEKGGSLSLEDANKFLIIISPFAPHLAEELWHSVGVDPRVDPGNTGRTHGSAPTSIHQQSWPVVGDIAEESAVIAVMVNGKLRGTVPAADQPTVEKSAREKISNHLEGKQIKKVVFVPNRVINFVI